MPLITHTAFLVPRGTSQLIVAPAYEKPLLQVKFNAGQGDRDKWVKTLPAIPAGLPKSAQQRELNCEAEMERLAATYGVDSFRKVYPLDELFVKAFEACQVAVLPGQEGAVPDMAPAPEAMVESFLELNVPSMDKAKAAKLVESGFQVFNIANSDVRAITAVTGLSSNLIRSVIEASKKVADTAFAPATRGVPSAPSQMRATSIEAPATA